MKRIKHSIKLFSGGTPGRLILWFGLIVLLVTWLITLRTVLEDRRLELSRAQQETQNLSIILERHIRETFARIDNSLFSLRNHRESSTGSAGMQTLLGSTVTSSPDLFNLVSIIGPDGNVILTDKKQFNPTYSGDRPFFIYHRDNSSRDILIGSPILGRVTGKWYIPVSLRLEDTAGRFRGVLLASVNPDYFSMIFHEVTLGSRSLVYLADFKGVVYSGMLGEKSLGLDKRIGEDKLSAVIAGSSRYSGIGPGDFDGSERIISREFIRNRPMFVSVEMSRDECLVHSRERSFYLIAIQLVISAIILLFISRLRQAIISRDSAAAELDSFFTTSLDLLCIAGLDGHFRRVNREWENVLGYGREELENRKFLDFVHPDDMQATLDTLARLGQNEQILNFTNRYRCRDGSYRYIEWRSTPHGSLIYAAARDITERKKTEESLSESEQKLKAVFNAANIGFSITDEKGNYVLFNNWWLDYLGFTADEIRQRTNLDLTHPDDVAVSRDYFRKVISGEIDSYRLEKRFIRKDGEAVWSDLSVSPVKDSGGRVLMMVGIVNDITEKKRSEAEQEKLQAQLAQSQKMESVGRLAGGVAHDFNNMLGAIFGYTELSIRKLDPGHPVYAYLQEIKKAAERSTSLTRQLLAFARRQTVSPRVLDLNTTVEGMLKMLRQIIGEDISLEWRPRADPVIVSIDPAQVDQVLVNLCVNARDAITDTGSIIIETGRSTFNEKDCYDFPGAFPGNYISLTVSDSGQGMNKETMNHLFEPFFTTKAIGDGTGLGLATVYGIIRQNRGFINVTSEPGTGTSFTIYLPEQTDVPAAEFIPEKEPAELSGHQTILLVEDETMLLNINRDILEQLGYTVLAASVPDDAYMTASGYDGTIDLIITDVIMPGMNGRELADRVISIHPDIKVLFISGYTANVIARHGVLEDGIYFLQKPFLPDELAAKVKETLAGHNKK